MTSSGHMILKGSHGTDDKSAAEILKNGFQLSGKGGMWGDGSYFWVNRGQCYKNAELWWENRFDTTNTKCSVICVEIDVSEECFLDMTDDDISDYYSKFRQNVVEREKRNPDIILSREDIQKIKEEFIVTYENELACPVKVIKGPVSFPINNSRKAPDNELGWPPAYIVRDLSCIIDIVDNTDKHKCSCR